MRFLAIDVETANANYSSICQIGIAEFQDGQLIDKWSTHVDPEAYFDPFNISIHGISEEDVENAPSFDRIYSELAERLSDNITVHHMPFDRIAINRACREYSLELIQTKWLDSAKIVRRTWDQFANKGYGLSNIAEFLKIDFLHHDALEDAIAAATIVHHACEKSQMSIEEWLHRVSQPVLLYPGGTSTIKLNGSSEGPFYGENIVFTGALFIPRKEAGKIAADLGCNVSDTVTKDTTILVVGTQDSSKLAGYEKSSKHRKAEGLIQKGAQLKILSEEDFVEMCNNENEDLNLKIHKPEPKEPKKPKKEIGITIDWGEIFTDILENLSDEDKNKLEKANLEEQKLLESIKDCTHEEKRTLVKEIQPKIDLIQQDFAKLVDEDDLISSIESEINDLQDSLYDLTINKIHLSELFETLEDFIYSLIYDLEEGLLTKLQKDCVSSILPELRNIKEKILILGKGE